MSEAMALEQMTAALAEIEGYLTEARVPVLGKWERSGKDKNGSQLGDLDVVGLGPPPDGRLLVAECKGYGGPDQYENWLCPLRLNEIASLVDAAANNIAKVADLRWEREFARNGHRPDEVWVVFSGPFWLSSNPSSWKPGKKYYKQFILDLGEALQLHWTGRRSTDGQALEATALRLAEGMLSADFDVVVRLLPVHLLLDRLLREVPVDMRIRRKRYPDTALELLRWLHRASRAGALDLASVQDEYRTRDYWSRRTVEESDV